MSANINHIIELRKKKQLKYWVTYLKIKKFCKGSGYISRTNTRKCCVSKYSTFINHINQMIKLGWMSKTRNGYRLTSYHKFTGLLRISIEGESVDELLAIAALHAWDDSVTRQICKITNCRKGPKRNLLKLKRHGIGFGDYSASVRWFANLMGYKSATSGSRIEKLMEQFELVKIQKKKRYLFDVNNKDAWTALRYSGLSNRFFIQDNKVYERLQNVIIPII